MTIEPGIYFIPELIDIWKAENKLPNSSITIKLRNYKDFGGIRIEDDVLVTGNRIQGAWKTNPKNRQRHRKDNGIELIFVKHGNNQI